MRNDLLTNHYGFVVDCLAEALRDMRKHNFTEIIDRHFSMGAHLNARDRKAVRKTVSGLVKILFPHGEVPQGELAEILGDAAQFDNLFLTQHNIGGRHDHLDVCRSSNVYSATCQ